MGTARLGFHIGDILSVLSGLVLSRRGLLGVTELEDYMIGAHVEGLERLAYVGAVRRSLQDQFPDLPTYTDLDVPPAELLDLWLERRAREFVEYLPVQPLSAEELALVRHRQDH